MSMASAIATCVRCIVEFQVKQFDELTPEELYEIIKTRFDIFVIEQNIMCRDLDDVDKTALHVFCRNEDGRVTGYLRVFWNDRAAGVAQIGRVVTLFHGIGIGGPLLTKGIDVARQMGAASILLHSQEYAIGYYAKQGFEVTSDTFLEDTIPHVEMVLRL